VLPDRDRIERQRISPRSSNPAGHLSTSVVLGRIVRGLAFVAVGLFLLGSCDHDSDEGDAVGGRASTLQSSVRESPLSLSEAPLFTTDDLGQPILARPMSAAESRVGTFAFADASDNDIKLYGPDGRRVGTLGRSGEGPGEFRSLTSAVFHRDSLLAFDFLTQRMAVFDVARSFVRNVPVPGGMDGMPMFLKSVDDSLLLTVGMAMSVPQGNMATLLHADQTCCISRVLENRLTDPAVIQSVVVLADARDGVVYGLVDDSLFAFDYGGRQLASGKLPSELMPRSWASLLAENDGQNLLVDGQSVFQGYRLPFAFVALDSGTVAVQSSPYDQEIGIDIVGGGTVGLLAIDGRGGFTMLGSLEASGGLLGRTADGLPLIVSYAGNPDAYRVSTLRLSALGSDGR